MSPLPTRRVRSSAGRDPGHPLALAQDIPEGRLADREDATVTPLQSTARVPLNALDYFLLVGERLSQRHGLPGVTPGLLHVNFRGRLDMSQLQDAADRLVTRWPLITARLVRSPYPAWVPTGAQRWHIRQQTLDSDSEADLLRAVYELGVQPFDLENEDPVRLIVLHRPGGDDMLTMKASHILLDLHGGVCLLQQLLDSTRIPPVGGTVMPPTDVLAQALANTPFRVRMKAVRRMMRQSRQVTPVTLPLLVTKRPAHLILGRVTRRWIDETASAKLQERLENIGPFANLSLAILASGCRTLSRYVPGPLGPRSGYVIMLPYNLRRGPLKRFPFHNLATRLELVARPTDLADRDELTRLFASQLRAQIADKTTIAPLQLVTAFRGLDRWAPWLSGRFRPGPRSLHASSVGEIVKSGRAILGATVDYCWINTLFMPFAGVSLNLIKAGRRHLAVFMHSPYNLADEQAPKFLDEWLEDLCRP